VFSEDRKLLADAVEELVRALHAHRFDAGLGVLGPMEVAVGELLGLAAGEA
jgi:hypothetical protein